jgi:hypothetical protein
MRIYQIYLTGRRYAAKTYTQILYYYIKSIDDTWDPSLQATFDNNQ